ncbi:MAG: hypothetical protein IJE04_04695 [Bacilli bacterium]|nr:hypothetical protein [Bacilli bacterium]
MVKDNFKVKNNIVLLIILMILLVIFFLLLLFTKDNSLIKDVKKFIQTDTKVLYISNKNNYNEYPIDLFKKYDINYLYIDSNKLTNVEETKLEKIINSKYLSNIILIYSNGKILDAIIEYESEESLNIFLQKNNIIPEIIGDNSHIIEDVKTILDTDYSLIYLPYKNTDEIDAQNTMLKDICEDYEINYKKIDAYLLSSSQHTKLNTLLQISKVEEQIVIFVKNKKIIGSIRGINNKKEYLEKLKDYKFVEEINSLITFINLSEFNNLLNNNEKNIIVIGKDECKYCDSVTTTLNDIAINYDIKINYINVGKLDSDISLQVEEKLMELNYNDGFTTPMVLVVENNKLLNYVIGFASEQYFVDIFTENGIIK